MYMDEDKDNNLLDKHFLLSKSPTLSCTDVHVALLTLCYDRISACTHAMYMYMYIVQWGDLESTELVCT